MPLAQPNAVWQTYQGRTVWITSGAHDSDQTVSGSLRQLSRIQDTTFSIDPTLVDNVYLDSSAEMYSPVPPGVNVDLRWLHTNGSNEVALGLARYNPSGTVVLGLDEEKNLYVAMEDAFGIDAITAPVGSPRTVLGLGNAVMTSFEMGAQVGGLIESRATMNCLTANVYTGASGIRVPAVDYRNGGSLTGLFVIPAPTSQYSTSALATGQNVVALGSREMIVSFPRNTPFGATLTGQNACYLQSFNIGLTINRQEQKPLGYVYPTARPVMYPIGVDVSAEAIMSSYQADALARFSCNTGFAVHLMVKQPCTNLVLFALYLDNLQLQSQRMVQGIGPSDTVSLRWRGLLKTPNDVFLDPYFNWLVETTTTGAWGESW